MPLSFVPDRSTEPGRHGRAAAGRALLLLTALFVLAGCRLDAEVTMTMNPDGSGEVALVVAVDADVVAQVPGLAGALQLDDATAAGWTVDGPIATDDGGLTVTLRHPFTTAEEATMLLRSLGPPFGADVTVARTATEDEVVVTVSGTATLPGGTFDAFADGALVQAAGGVPFATQLAASGATPASAMTVTLTMSLPGQATAAAGEVDGGTVTWDLPLDGSTVDLAATSTLAESGGGGGWAGPVSTAALVLLALWLIVGAGLVALVVRAQRRRRRRPVRDDGGRFG